MPIDHLFVLMLENRSFDQVLGSRPGVDGVDESRVNFDAAGRPHPQSRLCGPSARTFPFDPPHTAAAVAEQMSAGMSGFVRACEREFPALSAQQLGAVMQYLAPEELPMTNFLASQFALSDRWFTPVPSATIPNRLYAMSGHGCGLRDNPAPHRYAIGFSHDDSIFHKLDEVERGFRVYAGTRPPWVALIRSLWDELLFRDRLRPLAQLARDLAAYDRGEGEDFPSLIWLEPSYSWTEFALCDPFYAEPNCDHPPSDLMRGQALLQYVYESVSESQIWSRSALVVCYDEHGGFYDHVAPPSCMPGADDFETRGPRVPALVVSPFVEPGSVVRPPSGQVFDHCSVLKFLCERHGIDLWTTRLRDPTTASLSHFFSESRCAPAKATGLSLRDHPDYRIDLRSAREPSHSPEGQGMRLLQQVFEGLRRRGPA